MKTVKTYESFSDKYRLNENLLKRAWGKISKYFKKKFKELGWLYYALFLKKSGQLPEDKVRIFVPKSIASTLEDVPTEKELENVPELSLESLDLSNLEVGSIEEGTVSLNHPNPKMRNVNVEGFKKKIKTAFEMNQRRIEKGEKRTKQHSVFIWGAPGIGKTEIVNQVAEENDAIVIEWLLSQIDPTDFRGVPKIEDTKGLGNPKDERTVSKLPSLFPDSDTKVKGIMFFDEMNQANEMVLGAALSLVLGGRIGDYVLPENWIVVAAGNREIDLPGTPPTQMSMALTNRFAHVNYAPDLEDWIKWALKKKSINPDLIAFLKTKPEYYHKLEEDAENQEVWPSPRGWDLASEIEYFKRGENWKNHISRDDWDEAYVDQVGAEAAAAFQAYIGLKTVFNEKDVEGVFKNGAKGKRLPDRTDQAYAATASIASYKPGEKWNEKEVKNLVDYLLSLPNIEQRTPILSMAKDFHPEIKEDTKLAKIWWDGIKSWHKDMKGMDDKIK